jgi:hypothetical protein
MNSSPSGADAAIWLSRVRRRIEQDRTDDLWQTDSWFGEGMPAARQLIENDPAGEDIGSGSTDFAADLIGSHEE